MHTQTQSPDLFPNNFGDEETKSLLRAINEKLGTLIELQQARLPPSNEKEKKAAFKAPIKPIEDTVDTSWINPDRWYDNSEFCRSLNISQSTAQSWRSKRLISYVRLGNQVRYPGHDMIRFINVYTSRLNFVVTPIPDDDYNP